MKTATVKVTPATTSLESKIKTSSKFHPLLEQLSKEREGRYPISHIAAFQQINQSHVAPDAASHTSFEMGSEASKV